MHLSFHSLAIITAVIFGTLAAIWLLKPSLFLSAWNVDNPTSTGLVGRRVGALYSGIAVMLFLARNAMPSSTLSALIYGLVVTCLMLAILGLYELVKGYASKGILGAVLIELVLAILFLQA